MPGRPEGKIAPEASHGLLLCTLFEQTVLAITIIYSFVWKNTCLFSVDPHYLFV
jgi:hypothetical protein